MGLGDAIHALRVLARAGALAPAGPDRMLRVARAYRRWGATLAGAFATSGARFGERVAIVDERGPLSFSVLDVRTDAQAAALSRLGVRAGEVVGVLCRNHRGIVEISGALSKLGAHALYLNTGFSGPQLREVVSREAAVLVVHDDEFSSVVSEAGVERRVRSWPEGGAFGVPTLDELVADGAGQPVTRPSEAARTVILTSGTTGTPKGANREQRASSSAAVATLDAIPYRANETMHVAAPLFHSWGFANLVVGLTLGDTVVLARHFDPEETLASIARHRASVLAAVPVMLVRMLELAPEVRARYDTSSLRAVAVSGSALPGGVAERFMDAYGDVVYNLYGSTEVGTVSIASPVDLRAAPGTAGRPPRGTEVRLLGDDGVDVPPGAVGRIFVRSDLLFDGYTGGDSKDVVDGFMHTGDTGHLDAQGRLFVDGRDDEMIVSGGENVFPSEVEDLLARHPDIVEVAVVGVPDDEFGQRLRACIVRREGTSLGTDEVREYVRTHLARYKVPRDVEFLDALPRNTTGKVLKRALR